MSNASRVSLCLTAYGRTCWKTARGCVPNLKKGVIMNDRLHYGTPAIVLHWLVVALLAVQFSIGWLMPEVHAGPPGRAMTLHISVGLTILALILLRLVWRITHPVAPESSLPQWQRVSQRRCTGCFMDWFWPQRSPVGCVLRFAVGRSPILISFHCRCRRQKIRSRFIRSTVGIRLQNGRC
jgi:hypothetical protein